ncbi:MAG: GNAT family N-acetyltransferase [Rhodobacteraceae bacterium]|nr:GNAT family N-acetyltransferase [Paracoccaceae bacterium]
MTLRCRPIALTHIYDLFALSVSAKQSAFVLPPAQSIAHQAYAPGTFACGLWQGEVAVGLMVMFHPRECAYMDEGEDLDAAYLWQLLIDARHQGNGLGRAAIDLAAKQARVWGLPRLNLTYYDLPNDPGGFYRRCGFVATGRANKDGVEMSLNV